MDRHDVPDRAALRHRPRPAAQPRRAAGRRQLPHHRHQDLHLSGEHDLAENIVHLVLARLPDAPAGTKGISLFIVPKFVPDADGSSARATASVRPLEEKMGIHGNATCEMDLDGATGWLVAEPNKGLNAMFVMMNTARLGVGMQSLGLMEAAYQNSVAYAKERLQMRSLTGPKAPDKPADPIIVHPDVRRMLLTQRPTWRAVARFAYWLALRLDRREHHDDETCASGGASICRAAHADRQGVPDRQRFQCTGLAMQVYGGHGYIREWGMEQYVRDARINMIYEGTNTIQSLDLLGRKVLGDNGAKLRKFGELVKHARRGEGHRTKTWPNSSIRWPTWATRSRS
jgi:alkylation response protein AidB-like acyl-CoA dehydrogenase